MKNRAPIQILPETLIKRIAAGEVVERPASVVKELMENALDAGATRITLLVKDAGMELIQVVDNGHGMTEDDALICCTQHATSKVSSPDDLDAITTLGFRGEALPSISSVSRMSVTTKTAEAEEATQVLLDSGEIRDVLKTSGQPGTSVAVRDLFFNVPARRKFLKQPATELRHVITAFRRLAMANHEVDFTLFVNDEKTLDLRASSLEERVKMLLGPQKMATLIPVEKEQPGVTIRGFFSRPGEGRKSRNDQFFFLNRRFIVSRSLSHAVVSAYGHRLQRDEYPMFALFMEMDPRRFDVNVHPTKLEVRFADDRYMHDSLRRTLQESMRTPVTVPELHLVYGPRHPAKPRRIDPGDYGQLTLDAQSPVTETPMTPPASWNSAGSTLEKESPPLWQIHNRYIISQIKSGLTLIDQHVAHERILYERALKSQQQNDRPSQQLLFPQTVEMTPDEYLALTEMLPYLERIGFGLREFGKNTILIEAVPIEIKSGNERELLLEIIDEYRENREPSVEILDNVAKSFACKSAIKSGDKLEYTEMSSLIDSLFATTDPYFCPHGRPIVVNLSLDEIDKRFGR